MREKIAIGAAVVLALLACASFLMDELSHDNYTLEVIRIGPTAMLLWEAQGGDVYEVQGRMFDGDWSTIMISGTPRARVQIPLGIASYRVRPWTMDGPGQWSEPTRFMIRENVPAPIAPPQQDPRTLSEN